MAEANRPIGGAETTGDAVASPCIGVCALDDTTGLCRGCLRSGPEIGSWRDADTRTRLAILTRVEARRARLDRPPSGPDVD
jgi:predicted Fe-S protein YdhL (DUF1289 family)